MLGHFASIMDSDPELFSIRIQVRYARLYLNFKKDSWNRSCKLQHKREKYALKKDPQHYSQYNLFPHSAGPATSRDPQLHHPLRH